MMFFIYAKTYQPDSDGADEIVIGLYTTPELAIKAARAWIKEEREAGVTDDICLCGWRAEPDSKLFDRLDLMDLPEAKTIIAQFRQIEKEFPPEEE